MRTLIYKRTHSNDPDPRSGVFGNRDCMGQVRAWSFDAVIAIGGIGEEPRRHGIAGKLTWIGVGPQKFFGDPDSRGPQMTFRHFLYFGEHGPLLTKEYPALARHMYATHRRHSMYAPSSSAGGSNLDRDVRAILSLATASSRSGGSVERDFRNISDRCGVRTLGPARCSSRARPLRTRGCA